MKHIESKGFSASLNTNSLITMTDLSPATQAVMDAAVAVNDLVCTDSIAAALRAAAQTEYKPDMRDEMEVMFSEGWNNHRKELLSIADELEGAND